MWLICGTVPDASFSFFFGEYHLADDSIVLHDDSSGHSLATHIPVDRGIGALAAAAACACQVCGAENPRLLLAGDCGSGTGSHTLYAYLAEHCAEWNAQGMTFHYLLPDLDGHNRALIAFQELEPRPILLADAGFMYVAKMSGYAEEYDVFTPDVGELAFLADEEAPHPFYTRGFLLDSQQDLTALIRRATEHGNAARYMLVKGSTDYIVHQGRILAEVHEPSTPVMEAIGGTGDVVSGLVTGLLASGLPIPQACLLAARASRQVARLLAITPASQVRELLRHMPQALQSCLPLLQVADPAFNI